MRAMGSLLSRYYFAQALARRGEEVTLVERGSVLARKVHLRGQEGSSNVKPMDLEEVSDLPSRPVQFDRRLCSVEMRPWRTESPNFDQFTAFHRVSFSLFFNLMTKNKVSSLFRVFHPIADVLVGVMAGWLVGEIGVFRHFAQYLRILPFSAEDVG